jgi:MFS family permease
MVIVGGMLTTFTTINTALIQNHVSDAMRGRVMSLREIATGLGPAWSLIFGFIGEQTSVPFALGLLGTLCIAVSISLVFLLSKVRVSRVCPPDDCKSEPLDCPRTIISMLRIVSRISNKCMRSALSGPISYMPRRPRGNGCSSNKTKTR